MDAGGPPGATINPYAAPETPLEAGPAPPIATGRFQSVTPIAKAITVVLSLLVLFEVISIVNDFSRIDAMHRVLGSGPFTKAELVSIDQRSTMLGAAHIILYLVVVVQFCFFMPRANRNARAFGLATLENTPGWAAGVFFVPIWGLYKPYQAMKEIWHGSNPDPNAPPVLYRQPGTALMVCWWWAYIFENLAGQVVYQMRKGTNGADDVITLSGALLVSSFIQIVSALLAMGVVRAVAARQDERQRVVPAGTEPPSAPEPSLAPAPTV
jgi:hypothetical protein